MIWLFVSTLVVALGCVIWIADPSGWAILVMRVASLVVPAVTIAGAVYFRGYHQAFFIGASVILGVYLFDGGADLGLPTTEEELRAFVAPLGEQNQESRNFNARVYDAFDAGPGGEVFGSFGTVVHPGEHRTILMEFAVSFIAGVLSVFVRWCSRRKLASTK